MRPVRGALARVAILAGIAGFVALGVWQVERRAWKLDLIARVDARVAAAPVAPPAPADWPRVTAERDAYARVRVTGRFRHDREVAVQAVTERGAGYWILTPLETKDFTVLVNRGFVPPDRRDPATRAAGAGRRRGHGHRPLADQRARRRLPAPQRPGGGALAFAGCRGHRRGRRTSARWRPTSSMPTPPANPGGLPVGGLTVIAFRNSHLVYALTWFALAAGLAAGGVMALRRPAD